MSILLRVRGLQKRFGTRLLLDIAQLEIATASATVLTGANGAGKTTLLRVLGGLDSAQVGTAQWRGSPVTLTPYAPILRASILYVHQRPLMFCGSVETNVGYGLAARGIASAVMRPLVEEAMQWAGIMHLRGTRSVHWSGGERQRVALARARVLRPQLLLLDEPSANLDGQAREQVMALIPTLLAEGSSVIMACHDRDLIGIDGVQRLKLMDGRLQVRAAVSIQDRFS